MRLWLIEKRKHLGLTQEEVSRAAGISRSYYARIECGDFELPPKTAKKIADVLLFDWTEFYSEAKEHAS